MHQSVHLKINMHVKYVDMSQMFSRSNTKQADLFYVHKVSKRQELPP